MDKKKNNQTPRSNSGQANEFAPVVSVLGHVDHGKCVAGNTIIPLSDGSLVTAQELFKKYSKVAKLEIVPNGERFKLKKSFNVFSFNGEEIVSKRVSHIWRLSSPKTLIKTTLFSGDTITTTPEHPFFIFTPKGEIIQKRADELNRNNFVIVPKTLRIRPLPLKEIQKRILNRLIQTENWVVFLEGKESDVFWQRIKKYKTHELISRNLFTTDGRYQLYKKRLRFNDYIALGTFLGFSNEELYNSITSLKNSSPKRRAGHTSNKIKLPKKRSDFTKLGYVLGCIVGDGSLDQNNIYLHNNDSAIYKTYRKYLEQIFQVSTKTKQGHTAMLTITNGGKTLKRFLSEVFDLPTHNKSARVVIPELILYSKSSLREFIAGLFDTDGYVSKINHLAEFTSKSEALLKELGAALLYFDIHSSIYHKKRYTYLRIANKPYLDQFLQKFNIRLHSKKERLQKSIVYSSVSRIFDYTPISTDLLKGKRVSNDIIPYWNSYQKTKGLLTRPFLKKLSDLQILQFKHQMQAVLNTDISPVRVRTIERVESNGEFVYDFTIPKLHNFVAERIIIHNTTLLDKIRETSIAQGEHGGITQKIGASQIEITHEGKLRKITFIDTPGHEAFANMRSQGVNAADIALLIIAADDGIKPQTQESIAKILEAKIPYIVVFTKIDLETANIERVKQEVIKEGILLEGLGGDISYIGVSAKTGEKVQDLLDLIILVYDLSGIKKDKNTNFTGVVVDAKQDMRRGVVATVVIKSGILKIADKIFAHGKETGKVRAIIDTFGHNIKVAIPGDAVEVLGLSDIVPSGTVFIDKQIEPQIIEQSLKPLPKVPADIMEFLKAKAQDIVPMVLKTETSAEMEAIKNSLPSKIKVIYEGQGDIAVSDVLLAKDFSALIIGFNVGINSDARLLAESEHVFNKSYRIIYELLDELNQLIGAVGTKKQEKELGRGTILTSFLGTSGPILGTRVISGRLAIGDRVRILRGEKIIGEASIASIKKGKEDAKLVLKNDECGIMIHPEVDFAKGDAIIAYSKP